MENENNTTNETVEETVIEQFYIDNPEFKSRKNLITLYMENGKLYASDLQYSVTIRVKGKLTKGQSEVLNRGINPDKRISKKLNRQAKAEITNEMIRNEMRNSDWRRYATYAGRRNMRDYEYMFNPTKEYSYWKPFSLYNLESCSFEEIENKIIQYINREWKKPSSLTELAICRIENLFNEKVTDTIIQSELPEYMYEPVFDRLGYFLKKLKTENNDKSFQRSYICSSLKVKKNGEFSILEILEGKITWEKVVFTNTEYLKKLIKKACKYSDSIKRNLERLNKYNHNNDINIDFDESGNLINVHMHLDSINKNIQITKGKERSQISNTVTALINQYLEEQKEKKRKKEEEKKRKQREITKLIATSDLYGNMAVAEILRVYKEANVRLKSISFHTVSESETVRIVHKKYKTLLDEHISTIMEKMCKENIISWRWIDGEYCKYKGYFISNHALAKLFMDPEPRYYGKNKKYDLYTDTDWGEFLKHESSDGLTLKQWEKLLPILEHPVVLEKYIQQAQRFFKNAPDGIKSYIETYRKMENSRLRKQVYQKILT